MSDTSETSAIDDKKQSSNTNTTNGNNPGSETKTFFGALIFQLFNLFILIIAGGAMLWSAKVAQTNLMPTDIDCAPYKMSETTINDGKPIIVNVDVVKSSNSQGTPEIKSTKIEFPIEENMNIIKFGIFGLNSIREWTDGPNSNPYTLYLGTIWQKMSANYSSMMNGFYNVLNENCSESVIIFLAPFIMIFVLYGVGLINGFYGVLLWFTQLYLLFSTNVNKFDEPVLDSDGKPVLKPDGTPQISERKVWKYKKGDMGKHWVWSILYTFMSFITVGFPGAFIIIYFLIRGAFSSLFLPFQMKAKTNVGESASSEYTFSTLMGNILKYKMSVIMYIVSLFIISDAYSVVGALGAFIGIVACIFVYSFYPNIYQQFKPGAENAESTINLAPYKMVNKVCTENIKKIFSSDKYDMDAEDDTSKRTWLEWLLSLLSTSVKVAAPARETKAGSAQASAAVSAPATASQTKPKEVEMIDFSKPLTPPKKPTTLTNEPSIVKPSTIQVKPIDESLYQLGGRKKRQSRRNK